MNRRYTTEQFKKIVDLLRENYNDVMLTTDIIVGFPQESEKEFEETYEFLKEINFYKMHVFKYSPRKGTKAAQLTGQIEGNLKELRSQKLLELSDINQKKYNEKYLNKEVDVLFEEKKEGIWKGHTQNYIQICLNTNENLENKILKVKCVETKAEYMIGECNKNVIIM